ncbi:hypothetical protein BTXL6_09990 [Bacillus thuringiensis]|nr:hypothetical protein BTXL6_27555 [Bacillus thuringiensis]ALL21774.1 hypothetical protein BTXL6_09990 [Bacillus thuringiensis]EEM19448.1 hypothetical protein bthur0001_54240 [Bacillus thuringiensis serovar tochigiensis BGSC 4Y1]
MKEHSVKVRKPSIDEVVIKNLVTERLDDFALSTDKRGEITQLIYNQLDLREVIDELLSILFLNNMSGYEEFADVVKSKREGYTTLTIETSFGQTIKATKYFDDFQLKDNEVIIDDPNKDGQILKLLTNKHVVKRTGILTHNDTVYAVCEVLI